MKPFRAVSHRFLQPGLGIRFGGAKRDYGQGMLPVYRLEKPADSAL